MSYFWYYNFLNISLEKLLIVACFVCKHIQFELVVAERQLKLGVYFLIHCSAAFENVTYLFGDKAMPIQKSVCSSIVVGQAFRVLDGYHPKVIS